VEPERARELLARERERLENGLRQLVRTDFGELATLDQHLGDQGSELFENERDEGLARALREELRAVERAEKRLEDGSYGRSIDSGEPIPDERLEAVPHAERTVEEQQRYERG
jgi:DnaK suppressor protein